MAGRAQIELKFGDGTYLFGLPLPQILELQRLCGAGIFVIYSRLLKGRYVVEGGPAFGVPHQCEADVRDIYETIRLGLIGGNCGRVNGAEVNVSPVRASELVATYCHGQPLKDCWDIAASVMLACVEGYDDGQKKSPPGGARRRGSTKLKSSPTAQ